MAAADRTCSRRAWLRAVGLAGVSLSGWFGALAAAAGDPRRKRSCILLWMSGGPSQMDTFDLKPGHANGGTFREIQTAVPGIRISEHLPQVAGQMRRLALVRSMSTKEGDHGRATYHLRTGYQQQGPIHYPALGAVVSKELGDAAAALPGFVSIGTGTPGAGFLGPRYAPLVVGGAGTALGVQDLGRPAGVRPAQAEARLGLLDELQRDFVAGHPDPGPRAHQAAVERAVRLMKPAAARAFDLDEEPAKVRERYGDNRFGQGCLLARRLVERGVPFVEVALPGWDTHFENFPAVRRLSATLDAAWATLLVDLEERGLLDSTLVVWMGEFGRTPQINGQSGRDHFPSAWTAVLGGGGIAGGRVVGKTSPDGVHVVDRPVPVPDFMATVCRALGLDPTRQNLSNVGRPIRLADAGAKPLEEILA
jgi:uncharacterized protein (DUF1501 family)